MSEKETLEIEIKLLQSLEYVSAWTGSLSSLKESSYIKLSDVTKLINEKRELLKIKNND